MNRKHNIKNQNLAALLQLMEEHPALPVVAMVDSEIVADDGYARWLGSWGSCYLETYYKGEEQVHFYDDDDWYDIERVLAEVKGWDWVDEASEAERLKAYQELPWIKCIVVDINQPEV